MKGLLCKDLTDLFRPFNFIAVIGALIAAVILKSIYLLSFIPVYFAVLPFTWLQNDEISRWEIRQMTMPFSRRTVVTEKYLISFLLLLAAAALTGFGMLFCVQGRLPDTAAFLAWLTGACMPCALMPSLLYPFCFRFGVNRTKWFGILLIALFAGCVTASLSFPTPDYVPGYYTMMGILHFFPSVRENQPVIDKFNLILSAKKSVLLTATLAAYAVLAAVSWLLSLRGFRRREF